MTKQLKNTICTVVEVGGVLTLAGIAFNEIIKRDKVERKLIDTEFKLALTSIDCGIKKFKVDMLEKELDELKNQNVEKTES